MIQGMENLSLNRVEELEFLFIKGFKFVISEASD